MDSRLSENPSAGRFDPPPPHLDPNAPRPVARRWWFRVLMVAVPLYPVLLVVLRPYYRGTPLGWLPSLLLIPLLIVEWRLRRLNAEERGKDTPFTPAHKLTR